MAGKSGAARRAKESGDEAEEKTQTPSGARKGVAKKKTPVELDRVIHERVRLAIVSALAGKRALSFNELKKLLGITDGNLSVHARRLEDAGFIACEKTFVDRMPHTEYRLTAAGSRALNEYLDHMESLIRRVREG